MRPVMSLGTMQGCEKARSAVSRKRAWLHEGVPLQMRDAPAVCLDAGRVFLCVLVGACFMGGLTACVTEHCYADRDCPSPKVCDREPSSSTYGKCVYACVEDADCGEGFRCENHACVSAQKPPVVCPPDMVSVEGKYCVDMYEASRRDATETSPGTDESVARSVRGVLPWLVKDNATAEAACKAAGKRLCTPTEWEKACRGPNGTVYGYGDTYEPTTCNGIDTFGPGGFHLLPTGSLPGCTNGYGVFDMNGNVWEHVAGGSDKAVRGGAYNCSDSRTFHRCDYVPGNWTPSARGFRCCADGTPADGGTWLPDGGGTEAGCLDTDGPASDGSADGGGLADGGPDAAADGQIDGGLDGGLGACPDDMVPGGDTFCIDIYEASRPDATATSAGTLSTYATSRPGVLPWQGVTLAVARAACEAAGKRLCRPDGWVAVCHGPEGQTYSYGNTYDPTVCNGIDTFCNCGSGSACEQVTPCPYAGCYCQCGAPFSVKPTGSFPDCRSAVGAFDVTGNVWEIVDTSDGSEHFRGGAYNCGDSQSLHRCDYDATWGPSARGFRCCKDRG